MPNPTTRVSRRAVIGTAVGVVAAVVGLSIAASKLGPSTPKPCTDPAAQIASLPAGTVTAPTVWQGKGKYCTDGILVTQPYVTLDFHNAKVSDSADTVPVRVHGTPEQGLLPIIEVKDTTGVTIENVKLTGANQKAGGPKAGYVGQAGVSIRSSTDVTVKNVDTTDTFGDGLTVFVSATKPVVVPTDITVDRMVIDQPGRDCISPAAVTDSSFDNITCKGHVPDSAADFESDIKGLGDDNLTFTNFVAWGGINIIEPVGTVSFTKTVTSGKFKLASIGASVSYQGSFACARRAPGVCVAVDDGTLTLSDYTFGRIPASGPIPTQPYTLATPPGVLVGGP